MEVKNKADLIRFSTLQLSKMLGLPQQDANNVSNYLLSFQTEEEILQYLNEFLGANSPFTSQFLNYSKKLNLISETKTPPQQSSPQTDNSQTPTSTPPLSKNQKKKLKEKEAKQPRVVTVPSEYQAQLIEKTNVEDDFYKVQTGGKKKKFVEKTTNNNEYEEFFDPDSKKKAFQTPILIKKKKNPQNTTEETERVRQMCGCQGALHPFVNNCIKCGRIACEIEWEGPCYFCGYYITFHEETENTETKTQLINGIPKARDSVVASRSMIYDDQSDYYNFNDTWLSAEEKSNLRKKEAERQAKLAENKKKFTIDFGGRKILADEKDTFEAEVSSSLQQNQTEQNTYMSSEDFRKMRMDLSKKDASENQRKKKRDALDQTKSTKPEPKKRLQSEFYPEEDEENNENETNESKYKYTSTKSNQLKNSSNENSNINLPPGLTYKPNFITKKEEQELIKLIDSQKWETDLSRRTQQYIYKYDYQAAYNPNEKKGKSRLTKTQQAPTWLLQLCERLHSESIFDKLPDQIIINEYTPGQGIAPHLDHIGSFGNVVVSLSLLSPVLMDFQHRETKESISVFLKPCSLVILSGDSRLIWTHGIKPNVSDYYNGSEIYRKRRVSITFRTVLNG